LNIFNYKGTRGVICFGKPSTHTLTPFDDQKILVAI
jgi:hypothetical protein